MAAACGATYAQQHAEQGAEQHAQHAEQHVQRHAKHAEWDGEAISVDLFLVALCSVIMSICVHIAFLPSRFEYETSTPLLKV